MEGFIAEETLVYDVVAVAEEGRFVRCSGQQGRLRRFSECEHCELGFLVDNKSSSPLEVLLSDIVDKPGLLVRVNDLHPRTRVLALVVVVGFFLYTEA